MGIISWVVVGVVAGIIACLLTRQQALFSQ